MYVSRPGAAGAPPGDPPHPSPPLKRPAQLGPGIRPTPAGIVGKLLTGDLGRSRRRRSVFTNASEGSMDQFRNREPNNDLVSHTKPAARLYQTKPHLGEGVKGPIGRPAAPAQVQTADAGPPERPQEWVQQLACGQGMRGTHKKPPMYSQTRCNKRWGRLHAPERPRRY
jgi:hypothetical protein